MSETLEFLVTGEDRIHCAGCEERIVRALMRIEGVRHVEASADTQQISVVIKPEQVGAADVETRLSQLGYDVTLQGV